MKIRLELKRRFKKHKSVSILSYQSWREILNKKNYIKSFMEFLSTINSSDFNILSGTWQHFSMLFLL